jgi:tetraacyldisaccharide 4'-kinase
VDPARHDAASVGDEPLLMARDAPCWIAADRARGGQAIAASGAGMIVMDDGLQNTGLWQDFRLVVVDGATGFGNGRGIPAGPLREQIGPGLSRANAVVLIGDDARGILPALSANASVYRADLALLGPISYAAQRLVAFAGIGRPEKFRDSLTRSGAVIAGFQAFPDHHAYTIGELAALADQARRADALLVTTEKDWVRLDADWRGRIAPVPVRIVWRDEVALSALLDRLPARG